MHYDFIQEAIIKEIDSLRLLCPDLSPVLERLICLAAAVKEQQINKKNKLIKI